MGKKKSENYEKLAKRLGRQLASRMTLQNIEQDELAKKIGQSQSTISNIIRGKTDSSMKNIFLAFEALGLDPLEEIRHAVSNKSMSAKETRISERLINDPNDPVFIGKMGKFYTYFHSTREYETQIVRGILSINEEAGRCIAELRIGNNILPQNGFDSSTEDKIYKGTVHISNLQNAVFINLKNEELGEICQIICPFLSIQGKKKYLQCNIGVVTTCSAGAEQRVPTMHRIFMTRNKLNSLEEREIQGQLRLTKEHLYISEKRFQEMCEKEQPGEEFLNCFQRHCSKQMYYEIKESNFEDLLIQKPTGFRDICMLKLYSEAFWNNKVSSGMVGSIFHGLDFQKKSGK